MKPDGGSLTRRPQRVNPAATKNHAKAGKAKASPGIRRHARLDPSISGRMKISNVLQKILGSALRFTRE
jgi:hypothetical protein